MFYRLDSDRAYLEFGHSTRGVQCRVGQTVHRQVPAPMEGHKNGIFTNATSNFDFQHDAAAPRGELHQISIRESVVPRGGGMDLGKRLSLHIIQTTHSSRLVS